jgi:VanZ family protein
MTARATPKAVVLGWAPAVACMGAIWVVSSLSIPTMPQLGPTWADKAVHAVEFGVLGALAAHAALATWPSYVAWRALAFGTALAVGWGVLDEMHQAFVPGRSTDVRDLYADAAGGSVGATARALVAWAGSRPRRTKAAAA